MAVALKFILPIPITYATLISKQYSVYLRILISNISEVSCFTFHYFILGRGFL